MPEDILIDRESSEIALGQAVAVEHGLRDKTLRQWTQDLVRPAQAKDVTATGPTGGVERHDDLIEAFRASVAREPDIKKRPQVNHEDMLDEAKTLFTHLFNVTATKDYGNTVAKADVVISGRVLVAGAPVPYLLFLEDMVNEMLTELRKLPTRPQDRDWNQSGTKGLYETAEREIPRYVRTKEWKQIVAPTDKHQADVREVTTDQHVAYTREKYFSAALPTERKAGIIRRLERLRDAIQHARVQANTTKVPEREVAGPVLSYAFDGILE